MNKEELKKSIIDNLKHNIGKTIEEASKQEIFMAVSYSVRDIIMEKWINTRKQYDEQNVKQMYYLSSEFLMGRALGNNLINLNEIDTVKEVFKELGVDLNAIEDVEPDAGLGNGGLGRLAACFLDSLATLKLPGHGCSIRYRYGIFKQEIKNGIQVEKPDDWLDVGSIWMIKKPEEIVTVKFGEKGSDYYTEIKAVPYDMPITGYKVNNVNTLRLWDAEAPNKFELDVFDRGDYLKSVEAQNLAQNITSILYPNDNHEAGKELRLKQQYFFVSASVQTAIRNFKRLNSDFNLLPEKVAFQLNDTHPTVAVSELMRILMDEEGIDFDKAFDLTVRTCAYTNHTILSEALEKWPVSMFEKMLPRIYEIIVQINKRFCIDIINKFQDVGERIAKMSILADGQIRMAHLAIAGSHSTNGVAELHTEILKNQELKNFYELYPDRFNNKTNGITQRRWILMSNPELSNLITETLGSDSWITELTEIKKLDPYAENPEFIRKFINIKHKKKVQLAEYIKEHNGIEVDPDSIFDIQVKRLHEYKRQLLNVLHIMYLYKRIKENPGIDIIPRTFIFGAKSAPGYIRAKLVIRLINKVADLVNNDKEVSKKIKVVFLENFSVSLGQVVYPAADVSEQISTASKEASGTGNMKFALNGAVTLGTLDGANVEILEEVGEDNIFIFGLKADEVIEYEKSGGYEPKKIYQADPQLKEVIDMLINGEVDPENPNVFNDLYYALLDEGDRYFHLKDFESYKEINKAVDKAYRDKNKWAQMCIYNIARSSKFSSDRTIKQYADDIWNLKSVDIKN